jgi:Tfp pilus assembly protein PilF
LAIALFKQNDSKGAEQAFKKAIELDPEDANAHLGLSKVYIKLGKVEQSKKIAT